MATGRAGKASDSGRDDAAQLPLSQVKRRHPWVPKRSRMFLEGLAERSPVLRDLCGELAGGFLGLEGAVGWDAAGDTSAEMGPTQSAYISTRLKGRRCTLYHSEPTGAPSPSIDPASDVRHLAAMGAS